MKCKVFVHSDRRLMKYDLNNFRKMLKINGYQISKIKREKWKTDSKINMVTICYIQGGQHGKNDKENNEKRNS